MNDTVESLIAYCHENSRVCPLHDRWEIMWVLLPKFPSSVPTPPTFVQNATDEDRMRLLAEHIGWAGQFGNLPNVGAFLRGLSEDQWRHLGE